MKTLQLTNSINHWSLRRGFLLGALGLALAWLGFSPLVRALQPPDGGSPLGNTAEGEGATAAIGAIHSTVYAKDFSGADLGARINAADVALGSRAGEIVVDGGGSIATRVVISSRHTLKFLPGTYATSVSPAILLKNATKLVGAGWHTIIKESSVPGQFTVLAPYEPGTTGGAFGRADNVEIRDLQIQGSTRTDFNSAPAAILLGNCSHCSVDHVWLNKVHSIGLVVGGNSSTQQPYFADSVVISNCLLTHVASQGLAIINGKNVALRGNIIRDMGQSNGPGATAIDAEPNSPTDILENISIVDNVLDLRNNANPGNGIVFQSGGTTMTGPALISNNLILGGQIDGTVTNRMSNALFVIGVRDVLVTSNTVRRTGQCGVFLAASLRIQVSNNVLEDVGGGGVEAFRVTDTVDSRVFHNVVTVSGSGSTSRTILESGTSDRNTYIYNDAAVTTVGSRSKVVAFPDP